MERKKVYWLLASFILPFILIITLSYISTKNANRRYGFNRKYNPDHLKFINKIDLKYHSFYICGIASQTIYLGHYRATDDIWYINKKLDTAQWIKLPKKDTTVMWPAVQNVVDSPNIYSFEGNTGSILRTKFSSLDMRINKFYEKNYSKGIPISENTFIIRKYDTSLKKTTLQKYSLINAKASLKIKILDKQIDGRFDSDGMFVYVPNSKYIIYLFYYRNQFLCLDTNLNSVYSAKTIDTNSYAKLKVAKIQSSKSITMSEPPLLVNKTAASNEKYLFINSSLLSENENIGDFKKSAAIDVYDISSGKYVISFYIPDYKESKLSNFKITKNKLLAIHEHYLVEYEVNL